MQTPLAWKNLTSSPSKCLLAATGVGFAVVLMFMQIGFRNALLDSNVQIFQLFKADLVVISRARYNVSTEQRFPRYLIEQAMAQTGVRASCSVYVERGTASIQVEGERARPIRVIAMQLASDFFAEPELFQRLEDADRRNAALVDRRSKSEYGFGTTSETLKLQHVELNKKEVSLIGQFTLGTDFAHDGTILMSERMLPTFFPWRGRTGNPLDVIDIGLLQAQNGADLLELRDRIQALAPKQIQVYLTQDLIRQELLFWSRSTPIGIIFGIGTIMGLVVGAIICYQIQFTDISEHMPEFATLKAMGYRPRYFWSLILCQSLYLACLGFVPGGLVSWGLYWLLAEASGLIMRMTFERVGFVWALTVVMCVVSGALAIRKLFRADPASLF
jgi:putative ABC transport system permease protein